MRTLKEQVLDRYSEVIGARPKRVTNRKCESLVQDKLPFRGSNMYGEWKSPLPTTEPPVYVVYSWGEHFPLYIYEPTKDEWFINTDGTTNSSIQHRWDAQLKDVSYLPLDCDTMIDIINRGICTVYEEALKETQ